jgi:hypothetical protein
MKTLKKHLSSLLLWLGVPCYVLYSLKLKRRPQERYYVITLTSESTTSLSFTLQDRFLCQIQTCRGYKADQIRLQLSVCKHYSEPDQVISLDQVIKKIPEKLLALFFREFVKQTHIRSTEILAYMLSHERGISDNTIMLFCRELFSQDPESWKIHAPVQNDDNGVSTSTPALAA